MSEPTPNLTPWPTRTRTGIVFRPGNYGPKGVYSDADIDAMAGDTPLPIRMSHHPTLIEKAGKMGHCHRTYPGFDEAGKKVLFGVWDEPEPLALLLEGVTRTLSVEIDKATKKPVALALEVDPHIPDAAFFSAVEDAYAKFSRGEQVKPLEETTGHRATTDEKPMKQRMFIEQEGGALKPATPEEVVAFTGGAIRIETVPAPAEAPEMTPREKELAAEVEKMKAEKRAAFAASTQAEAEREADRLIDEHRILPGQKGAAVALFCLTAQHEANREGIATFSTDPGVAKFSKSDLSAFFETLTPHTLTTEEAGGAPDGAIAVFEQEKTIVTDAATGEQKVVREAVSKAQDAKYGDLSDLRR